MTPAVKKEKIKKVSFSFMAPHAESVLIAGDFNDWNPAPMKRDKKGVWKASFSLAPGAYQYRFFVDSAWQTDPNCTDFVENPFGTFNCVKKVE